MRFLVLAIVFCSVKCFASGAILTGQDAETWLRLESFYFKPSLSQDEAAFVTNSLVTHKDTIAEAALCVIVVHDIPLTFPSKIGREHGYNRTLAKIIANGRERKQSPVHFLCKDHYKDDMTPFVTSWGAVVLKLDDSFLTLFNEKLGRMAAVFFARELRQGKNVTFNEDDYSFSDYDKLLLKYAKFPEREVPKMIIPDLAKVTSLSMQAHDLVRVLVSYDDINLDLILSTLQTKELSEDAKSLLLLVLTRKINALGSSGREKIRVALRNFDFASEDFDREWAKSVLLQEIPPKK